MKYNFDGKAFLLVENSASGEVSTETTFHYKQEGALVTAEYLGGSVHYGKIIAILKDDSLDMLYQCKTVDQELKAGQAKAKVSLNIAGKIVLQLNWEWLNGSKEKGTSEFIEQ